MAIKVIVEYSIESCEECPYCYNEIGGYPIIPICIKTGKSIVEIEEIASGCPFYETAKDSIH